MLVDVSLSCPLLDSTYVYTYYLYIIQYVFYVIICFTMFIILYCIVLYCIVLYCIVLYFTILYDIVLCPILFSSILFNSITQLMNYDEPGSGLVTSGPPHFASLQGRASACWSTQPLVVSVWWQCSSPSEWAPRSLPRPAARARCSTCETWEWSTSPAAAMPRTLGYWGDVIFLYVFLMDSRVPLVEWFERFFGIRWFWMVEQITM